MALVGAHHRNSGAACFALPHARYRAPHRLGLYHSSSARADLLSSRPVQRRVREMSFLNCSPARSAAPSLPVRCCVLDPSSADRRHRLCRRAAAEGRKHSLDRASDLHCRQRRIPQHPNGCTAHPDTPCLLGYCHADRKDRRRDGKAGAAHPRNGAYGANFKNCAPCRKCISGGRFSSFLPPRVRSFETSKMAVKDGQCLDVILDAVLVSGRLVHCAPKPGEEQTA